MAKHTPGPWHRNVPPARKYTTVWSGRNTHVAHVVAGAPRGSGNGETMLDEEIEANIDLIAAAPDLLAALQFMLDWFEQDNPLPAYDEMMLARDAIAKATGVRS